jgi:hypothetical protein
MALNPNIALGVRGVEVANPLAQYAQISQLQSAQNQNALAQYQLSAAQRADEQQNRLYEAVQQPGFNLDFASAIKYGAPGIAAFKAQTEAEAAGLTRTQKQGEINKQNVDILDSKLKQSRAFLDTLNPADPNAPQQYLQWHQANHADPVIGPALKARGVSVDQSRAQIEAAIAKGPQAFADLINGSKLGTEKFMELNKPTTQVIDQSGQSQMFQTPGLGGVPRSVGTFADVPLPGPVLAQKKEIARAGAATLPAQEKAFETKLGTEQADELIKSRNAARDAAAIIDTVKTGRDIMKSGMITGAGADFLVNLNQGLKTAGIDAGYADASANSQAFAANMAANVGKLIKQFGSGTGLSDADRKFAIEMAGGRVSLDSKAIDKILDINEKAARNTITRHNKDVKGVKTNIPLEVEMPPEVKTPIVGAPAAAIEYLRANPAMKDAFNAKYGAGAADRALKGQ